MSIDQAGTPSAGGGAGTPSWLPVEGLEGVDPAGLVGVEVIDYVRECHRARNRDTARFLTALHEAGRTEAGRRQRRAVLDEFSGDEAAAALGWSRAMASRWLDLADDLLGRLGEVHTAMRGGDLDESKARVFSDWTRDLADDHAHQVCHTLLPEAPTLPVGALIERIQDVAHALDADWAARRETNALKKARLLASRNPSGTANLSGCDLPVDRTAISMARAEALAAELRRRGIRVKIEQLRAEVYLAQLDGTAAGLDDDTLLDLLEHTLRPPDPDNGPDNPDGGPDNDGPNSGPDSGPDTDGGPDDDGSGPDDGPRGDGPEDGPVDGHDGSGGGSDDEPGDEPVSGPGNEPDDTADDSADTDPADTDPADTHPANDGTPDGQPANGEPANADHGDDYGDDGADQPGDDTGHGDGDDTGDGGGGGELPRTSGVRTGLVEIRLQLSTALGLDDHPAQLPGWGTLLPATARAMLERYHHGEWRIVLTDHTGRLQHVLLTRHRPRTPDPPPGSSGRSSGPRRDHRRRRGRRGRHGPAIVELQVPTTLLAALDPADHPHWARLLTDLRTRLAGLTGPGAPPPGAPDQHLTPEQARHRRPSAEVLRWLQVRDRCCVAPSCRRTAHATDIDHTLDHALGGPTLSHALGCWCRHHHRAKHHGGWQVTQPEPGRFLITTRAGATYETHPPRIIRPLPPPLPTPAPRPLPDRELDHHTHDADDSDDPPDSEHDRAGDERRLEVRDLTGPRRRRSTTGPTVPAPRGPGTRDLLRRAATTAPLVPGLDDPPPF